MQPDGGDRRFGNSDNMQIPVLRIVHFTDEAINEQQINACDVEKTKSAIIIINDGVHHK